jgi:hypothetical protein
MQFTMNIISLFIIISAIIFSPNAMSGDITIQQVVEKQAEGYFNCSFKSKKSSKKCHVKNSDEVITDKELVEFYGDGTNRESAKMSALIIMWPDKVISKFIWLDSMEICKLRVKCIDGYKLKFAEWPKIDYSNGLVILDENNMEHIRIW